MKHLLKVSLSLVVLAVSALFITNCKKDISGLEMQPVEHSTPADLSPVSPDGIRRCGAATVYDRMLKTHPEFENARRDIEAFTENYLRKIGNSAADRAVVSIPVVVHVVWNTAAQNISDAQIATQLAVLNADFRRMNSDASNTPAAFQPIAADVEVEFCMAQQKPDGSATNGIERRQTSVTSFSDNDAVKYYSSGGLDAWNSAKYLNLWVCNMSGGILGYAQFPGGPAATDGVVCTYTAFGTIGSATAPFNKGRTATHEVGHWLNLFHIWGDDGSSCAGSDQCADTPNQADEHYGCPSYPQTSCSNGSAGDMFMNYMDYVDDACMNAFTVGQKNRAHALFAVGGARYAITTSNGCTAPSGCGTPGSLAATNLTQTSATLGWAAVSGAISYTLQWKTVAGSTFTTVSNINGTSYNLTGLTAGTAYHFKVLAVCSGGAGAYSGLTNFTTQSSGGGGGGCTDIYETNNTSGTAKAIPVNTPITAKIGTSTDKDWFSFSNTTSQKNIRINLTNLPFDYDVYLYRGSTLVGSSENANTDDEEIVLNTTIVGQYKIKVIGYGGAYSNTLCYSLLASISSTAFPPAMVKNPTKKPTNN